MSSRPGSCESGAAQSVEQQSKGRTGLAWVKARSRCSREEGEGKDTIATGCIRARRSEYVHHSWPVAWIVRAVVKWNPTPEEPSTSPFAHTDCACVRACLCVCVCARAR